MKVNEDKYLDNIYKHYWRVQTSFDSLNYGLHEYSFASQILCLSSQPTFVIETLLFFHLLFITSLFSAIIIIIIMVIFKCYFSGELIALT